MRSQRVTKKEDSALHVLVLMKKSSCCSHQAEGLVYVMVREKTDLKNNTFNNAMSGIIV